MFEWRGKTNVKLPRVVPIQQKFAIDSIKDITAAMTNELEKPEVLSQCKPGMRAAIAVGSRGIGRLDEIVRALVNNLKHRGIQPFIVPSMGSHGGATAEGQAEVLAGYNITEELVGAPIRSSMEVVSLGELEPGLPVYFDKIAFSDADIVIPVARVKCHTTFRGPIESGLHKMLVIGLGKHKGAQTIHQQGFERFHDLIPRVGQFILNHVPVAFGIAIVENAQDQPALIEAVPASMFAQREPELLKYALSLMPQIPIENLDVLVVQEIGKDISGGGMDPNVTGRFQLSYISDGPLMTQKVVVLDLTEETHGNATGIGMADVTTRRLVDKIDYHAMYTNCITSTRLERAQIPVVMPNDYKAIALAIQTCNRVVDGQARLAIIKNTLELEHIYISEPLLKEVSSNPRITVVGSPQAIAFGANGKLLLA